jgi:glutaconate CoA-transferase subunit B
MNKGNNTSNYNLSQLMVTAAAREIADGEVVFVGMRLPLLGFLLAQNTHAPPLPGRRVSTVSVPPI